MHLEKSERDIEMGIPWLASWRDCRRGLGPARTLWGPSCSGWIPGRGRRTNG